MGPFSSVCATFAIGMAVGNLPASEPGPEAIVVPLESSSGRPSIEIRIDGKGPYVLLFDTGSGADLILDQELAAELGLKSSGTRRIGDPNSPEAIEAQVMKAGRVDLGGLAVRDVDVISWKRDIIGMGDNPRGVVGLGLFGSRLVTLDYPRRKLIVEPGELPEADGRTVLDASFDDGIPSVPIDAAKRLPLEAPPVEMGRGRTASGDYSVSEARLRGAVRVGDLVIDRPKLHFMALPSANPLEPSERPRLGIMTHGPKDGRLSVERVAPGSPAEVAGLRAGDQIVRLNGRAVAEMSASELGDALGARPLAIALMRDGAMVDVKLGAKGEAPRETPPAGDR